MARAKTKEPAADLLAAVVEENPAGNEVAATAAPKAKTKNAVARIEPPRADPSNLLVSVMSAIADPKCDPAKMQALLDVRERLMREEARVQFVAAYVDLRAELQSIHIDKDGMIVAEGVSKKSGKAYSQKSAYATYENISKLTAPILTGHRFALMLLPDVGKDGVGILMRAQLSYVCETAYGRIVHSESCAIAAQLETGGGKNNVQGIGSSLSYTKRYCVVTLLDLISHAPEDRDRDGNAPPKKSDVPLINAKQAADLVYAINDCGVGEETFCAKYEIGSVADLPAKSFVEAMTSCAGFKAERLRRQKIADEATTTRGQQ